MAVLFFITNPSLYVMWDSIFEPELTLWAYLLACWSPIHAAIAFFGWCRFWASLPIKNIPNAFPPSFRAVRWLLVILSLNVLIKVAGIALTEGTGSDVWRTISSILILGLVLLVPVVLCVRSFREMRIARRDKGLRCLRCFQDLRGLQDQRVCPECGIEFDPDELAKQWGLR